MSLKIIVSHEDNKYDALIKLWNRIDISENLKKPSIKDAKTLLDKEDNIKYFYGKKINCDFSNFPDIIYDNDDYHDVRWLTGC